MGEGKVDLPADLVPFKAGGEAWTTMGDAQGGRFEGKGLIGLPDDLKGDAQGGSFEGKGLIGLPDDLKDNVTSENGIPLSPQWLYAKPSECKPGFSASSGEIRGQNSLSHGTSIEPIQKDGWRLDGSQDKKDWRRAAPDIENSRCWREEERETGLLARRERKREGDRENDYRKSERRAENVPVREASDIWSMPSSDRWHEVSSRNSGHEARRDSKWSARWGPEDKVKDSRTEKKVDADKEDTCSEKQSSIGSNNAPSEFDARDKWRPRHRQEVQAGGSTVYRVAPGFALDKGRADTLARGFAPGRGRSNLIRSLPIGTPVAGPLGAVPVSNNEAMVGISGLSADAFRYPRGKLLDIYRNHKMFSSFDTVPDGLEEVPLITQSNLLEPLAFVAPDSDEEALLQDIWNGKITSSETSSRESREKMLQINDMETGDSGMTMTGRRPGMNVTEEISKSLAKSGSYGSCQKIDGSSCIGEHENEASSFISEVHSGDLMSLAPKADDICQIRESCSSASYTSDITFEANGVRARGLASEFSSKFDNKELATSFDIHAKLLDDPNAPFVSPFFEDTVNMKELCQENNSKRKLEQGVPPEELSLFYRDPQGDIQGPFLGVDIMAWFDQGFFNTDLPVCLSDALEGTPFRQLGEVMPHLKLRMQTVSAVNPGDEAETLVAVGHDLEGGTIISDIATSNALNERLWESSEKEITLDPKVPPSMSWHCDVIDPHDCDFPCLKSEISSGIVSAEKQGFHELAEPDEEEVLYSGRAAGGNRSLLLKPAAGLCNPGQNLSVHDFGTGEIGEGSLPNHRVDKELQPDGMLWSGLEGAHPKHLLSTNLSGLNDQGHMMFPELGRDTSLLGQQQDSFGTVVDSPAIHDQWLNAHGRNRRQSPNVLEDAMHGHRLSHLEQESRHLILEDHLLSQQLQQQLIWQQSLSSPHQQLHFNGSLLDQLQGSQHQESVNQPVHKLDHLLSLQFQQQQVLQLQHQQRQLQQRQLQQQQQLRHQARQLLQQHQHQQLGPHVQQLLFEQLLQQPMHEHSIGSSQVDSHQKNNTLDEILFRERLLHELQQQSLHPLRHHDPSLERFIQAKFGRGLHQQPDDILEFFSHPKHRQALLDQQLLSLQQEQLQAQWFPVGSRQHPGIEEERHGLAWAVDESGHLGIASAAQRRSCSAGTSQLDLFQCQQRQLPFEQLNHIDRSLSLHEHIQHGLYEPSSHFFERPLPSPVASHGLNMELVSQGQGLGFQDHLGHIHSSVQVSHFPSNVHSHHRLISNKFETSNMDALDNCWPQPDERLQDSLLESQFHQLHLKAERQRRDLRTNLGPEEQNTWTASGNIEKSKQAMDLHKNLDVHSLQSLEMADTPVSSYEIGEATWPFSGAASDRSFNFLPVQASLGDSYEEDIHGCKTGQVAQELLVNLGADGQANRIKSSELLSYESSSGALLEREQFLGSANKRKDTLFADSSMVVGLSEERMGFLGAQRKTASKHDSKGGNTRLFNFEMGSESSWDKELISDRLAGLALPNGSENSLLNRAQVSRVISSQGLATVPTMRVKDYNVSSSEGRRDPGGGMAYRVPEVPAAAKDVLIRGTSGEMDTLDASFVGMLKSTRKPMPEADPAAGLEPDGGLATKNNKKKGKKGRQIDPSLLGFKVHSNRILMGEIQRPDD